MNGESVWLGPLRGPVRLLMIGFAILAVGLIAWLIVGHAVFGSEVAMYEMLRPAGRPLVQATLLSLGAALLLASMYLSDTIGAIEPRPTGFVDVISLICSRLAMIGIVFVVIVMFYEVVSRYVFEKPTLWANELSLWIAGFVFLLAGLYAKQQRSHIRIYIIYDLMPRWAQKLCDCVSVALIWAFTLALVWGGYNEARDKFFRGETFGTAWDPPIPATIKPAILIIIALVAIQSLSNLIADWNKPPESHTPMDDIDETEIENIRRTLEE
ncbi:TRAP transporter small permease subunit [Ostreiculturibacter nitratireducens]|uniref:TRAP transporter small permease subunit n=1 Tax=Ostreiculturibacter nitratireducens TaxID=3075226 RepID=UPI0031B630C1